MKWVLRWGRMWPFVMALGVTPAVAVAAPDRTPSRPATVFVEREVPVEPMLRAELEALALARDPDTQLRAHSRPARGRSDLEVVQIRGQIDGIELDRPLGTWLADRRAGSLLRHLALRPAGPIVRAKNPLLSADQAIAAVEATSSPGRHGATKAEPRWHVTRTGTRRVWWVDPPPDLRTMTNPVFEVDAATGHVRLLHDHIAAAQVRAFPINPALTPKTELFDLLELPDDATTLSGPRLRVSSCTGPDNGSWSGLDACTLEELVTADVDGDFVYEPPEIFDFIVDDPFAEASLYFHAEQFMASMDAHGVPPLFCISSNPEVNVLNLVANYHLEGPEPMNNAFYTGWCSRAVLMGQGTGADSSYDRDIVAHEMGHAIVHNLVGTFLGVARRRPEAYVSDASALNESFADFLSSSFTGDPEVAEYWGPLRNNDNERACLVSFNGQVHNDSEAFAGAMWRLYEAEGEVAVDIVLDVLSMLSNDATFEEAAEALRVTTEATLGAEAAQMVEDELNARGLLDCPRLRAYEPGLWFFLSRRGEFQTWAPPPMQVVVEVPEDAVQMHVQYVVSPPDDERFDSANFVMRQGSPVEFTYSDEPPFSVEAEFDHAEVDAPNFATATMPVTGGEPAYLAFVNTDDTTRVQSVLDVQFDLEPAGADETGSDETGVGETGEGLTDDGEASGPTSESTGEPPAGTSGQPTATDGDPAGCGCRSTAPRATWALLPLLALARRRRRVASSRRPAPRRATPSPAR